MTPVEQYIREYARSIGIDEEVAVRVALSEGGRQSFTDVTRQALGNVGDHRELSYGPYQMNIEGGLGARALAQNIDPRKPEDAYKTIKFALDTAKNEGWGAWYGHKGDPFEGISGKGTGASVAEPGGQADSGDYKTAREDTPSYAHPTSDTFKLPPVDTAYGGNGGYGGPGEGASHFGGTGLGTPATKGDLLAEKSPWPGGGDMPPIPQQPAYQLTPQPAATVAKAQAAPMVNMEQQQAQRQQLAMLLQQLNAPLAQRQGG